MLRDKRITPSFVFSHFSSFMFDGRATKNLELSQQSLISVMEGWRLIFSTRANGYEIMNLFFRSTNSWTDDGLFETHCLQSKRLIPSDSFYSRAPYST